MNARGGEPLLGREGELSSLAEALDTAKRGEAQVVVLEGEAGMGKTALLRWFVSRQSDLAVLEASGDEAEAAVDHGVISQLARSVRREPLASLPLLSSGPTAGADPFSVGAELVQALGILQEQVTVLVVVDDLHWADSASARALLFALRRLRADQVLVILALRPDGLGRLGDGWRRLLSDSSRIRRLVLQGLSGPDVRGLAALLGQKQLSSAAAERLRDHTHGHPLYLRSLLEELPASALDAAGGPLPAPHSLAETVVARLSSLSPAAQALVAAAAAVGERFSFPTVAAIAGIPDATRGLEEALAAGLLEQRARGTVDDLSFPHPLVRAAVYGDLSPTRRRALHASAATLIHGTQGLSQRVAAAEGPDETLAGDLEETASAEILGGASSAAADHLLWASELSSDATRKERRLLGAAFAVVVGGDEARAAAMKAAVEACGDGPRRSYTLGWLSFRAGNIADAEGHFRRSVELERESASREGLAAGGLAILGAARGDGPTAVDWARRALDSRPVHPAAHASARIGLALGLALTGRATDALSAIGPIDLQHRAPAPFEAELLATRGQIRLWTNDLPSAIEDLSTVVRWARSGATVRRLADAYANLADAQYRTGAWDDAVVYAELGVSLAEDMEAGWELSSAHAVASYLYSGRGAWDLASEHLGEARLAAERFPTRGAELYVTLAQATMARARGDNEAIITALGSVREGPMRRFVDDLGSVPVQVLRAEALIGLGRWHEGEEATARLEEIAGRPQAPSIVVEACRLRGSLEDARGDPKRAAAAFTEGRATLEGMTLPFGQGLLDAAHGRFLRRNDQRRAAITALRAARETFAAMDARPYTEFCDVELASCGLRPRPGAPANPFGLTAKERAVAHLAVEGMSNREIGAELYVSAKAVEYHLSNVFAKLGVTSRRQLRPHDLR